MSQAGYVDCPNCRDKKLGPYNIEAPSKNVSHGTCTHCGKRYTVEYGQGRIKATKGSKFF